MMIARISLFMSTFTNLLTFVLLALALGAAAYGACYKVFVIKDSPFKLTRLRTRLMFGAWTTVILMGLHIESETRRVHEGPLKPIIAAFDEAVRQGPSHRFAREERGSILDYDGSLDEVTAVRDHIIDMESFGGLWVRWWTDGETSQIQGTYYNEQTMLLFLVAYMTTMLFLLFVGYMEKECTRKVQEVVARRVPHPPVPPTEPRRSHLPHREVVRIRLPQRTGT